MGFRGDFKIKQVVYFFGLDGYLCADLSTKTVGNFGGFAY